MEGSTIVGGGAGLIGVTRGACANPGPLAPDLEIQMTNTIAHGGTWDVYAQSQCGNGPATSDRSGIPTRHLGPCRQCSPVCPQAAVGCRID